MQSLIRFPALILIVWFCLQTAVAETYTEIVSFGDSLSDNGNFAPYPPPFPGKSAYPTQTWVKQLAGKLHIATFECAGTGPVAAGTNYAFGGAATKYTVDRGWGYGSPFNQNNLTAQITGRYLNKTVNSAGPRTGAGALHTITIGGNDLLSASTQPAQLTSGWATLNAAAANAVKSAEGQVIALGKAGVKHVLWANLPDFSDTPYARILSSRAGEYAPVYLEKLKAAVRTYNTEMDKALIRLAAHPDCAGLRVTKLDLAALFVQIAATPSAYGFANVTDNLTAIPKLGLSTGNPKGNVDDYFFLDELHPSFRAHAAIAGEALRVLGLAGTGAKL